TVVPDPAVDVSSPRASVSVVDLTVVGPDASDSGERGFARSRLAPAMTSTVTPMMVNVVLRRFMSWPR
ncbi:MAG: hypothetical protein OSA99_20005, partial [Acidimicrobiales bacterium]|nr:hypothetical protein [Acidimicrobiales bacterium]